MARLDEICRLNMGQSPDSSSYNEVGDGLPFFQGNADFGELHPKIRIWCNAPAKIAHPGDILISVRAPIGALNIADRECCIGRGLAALTVNENLCNSGYLWYAIANKVDELNSKGTGSTFKAISKNVLGETEVFLPSLDRQQQISATLDKLTSLISLRKQQLAKLDELVKARFLEMFGDPVQNDKGWPLISIGDIAEIRIGPFGTMLHKEDYLRGGHALVNPSHIVDGKICVDLNLTVSDEKYRELASYALQVGDVVLGRRGEMGRCAVVYESGLLCGTGSMIIRPSEKMQPYFLQNILSNPTFKKTIEDKAVGVTMMNLNIPIVSSLMIPQLPIVLQSSFIDFLRQVDQQKLTIQQSLDKLEVLKKSLMQEYFK